MMARWDVYRDENGEAVTLTDAQLRAVWHAISVVRDVRAAEGYEPIGGPDGSRWQPDLYKSRLLGRMLMDGRPPLDEKPPGYVAARGYHLVEPDLSHWYFGSTPILMRVVDGVAVEIIDPGTQP